MLARRIGPVLDIIGKSLTIQLEHFGDKSQPKSFVAVLDSSEAFRKFIEKHPPPSGALRAGMVWHWRARAGCCCRRQAVTGTPCRGAPQSSAGWV